MPLVITDTGQTLQAPSTVEVARALGLSSTPSLPFYDLIVIGGGPAGLGAAVYGASEGLRTVLVEQEAIGGQAGQSSRIENYLGFPSGIGGGDLAWRATTQARRFGAEMLLTSEVSSLEVCGSARVVAPGRRQSALGPRRAPDHRGGLPPAWRRRASTPSPAPASTTGRRRPRPSPARTRTSTSSAEPTRPARRPCSSPAPPAASPSWCEGRDPRALDVALPDPADR